LQKLPKVRILFPALIYLLYCILHYIPDSLSTSSAATLAAANARIASLEAELKASQKAYDAATAAKALAEKSQKSALTKAKKAEKALADAQKENTQREQAIAERLHTMSSAAEREFFNLSAIFISCWANVLVDTCLFLSFLLL
jgi:hypothetical protein